MSEITEVVRNEWKEKILLEIKYHFDGIVEKELIKKIEDGDISPEDYSKLREELCKQKIDEYIEKRGGIERIVDSRLVLISSFENVRDAFSKSKDLAFFERKKQIEPALKEFYKVIKENFSNMESMWEYSIYFGMIREYSFDGTQYPFSDEIEHEESDVEPYKTLDALVSESRKKACKRDNKYFFYNRCMECQKDLNKLLAEHPEISNKSIDTQYHMGLPVYQHVFNFVKIDGRFFIIDPTYIQFCDMNCTEDVLGVPGAAGANPGMYLMEDGKKREFLHGLIRNGYFEATEENIKMYFDSFVLANRNSNFYKNHASASTMGTEILAQDYIKAIVEGKKLFFGKPEEIGAIQHTDRSKMISE